MKKEKSFRILSNKIRCLKCGDIIESKYRHDVKWCKCGAVAVDGGLDYLRRLGNREDYEELSQTVEKNFFNVKKEGEMPYITKDARKKFDRTLRTLSGKIENEGELNYVMTKLALGYIKKEKTCYSTLNAVIGVLTCIMQELYRRIVSPYEDDKIKSNGGVYDN